ncbi:DNA-directed RNA polymerase III subunit RPC4 isoform X2 [Lutzomyia longipalpis]|uniref:DNA-directed RNA polymerase III subunit RPC4 isoform X2 n=1 Tax=Lutzomyia longipalpis TaxID=7200 RepID=UPI0024845204|nr:DNA-directed RNA polymerase III subunit RPC4 isoform X2 [Lutzomyia longipalpis]
MATSGGNSGVVKVKQEPGVITIKTEPGLRTQMKTERLTSFKLPRDLTLGGPGPGRTSRGGATKKVYTPNLNAVRQKNADVKTSRDTQQKKTVRPERTRNDRGGRASSNNYIQTMGVFSEGTAKTTVKRYSESSRYSSVESRPIRRSAASKRDSSQSSDPATALRDILDSSDDDDTAMDEDATMPVMLHADEVSPNAPAVSTIPFSTKIKADPDGVNPPQTLEEIFGAKSSQVFLLQLPDTLPGSSGARDPGTEDTRIDDKESETPAESLNSLRQQDEGLVGKIVRHKSGKTKLVLGNSQFDLDVGIDTDFLQQLVSIDANPERSGNMYNLGKVQTKLTATPDWEHMFRNML